MHNHNARWLLLFVMVFSHLGKFQTAASAQESAGPSSSRFPAMFLKTHSIFTQSALRPAWEMKPGGELIAGNASVQFHDPNDAKASFSFPVTDLGSLEQRHGPEGFRVLRIKLQNGKHFDLVPDVVGKSNTIPGENRKNDLTKRMDEGVTAMEKAIRDLAAENKVALK